jgi:hypothetical protein
MMRMEYKRNINEEAKEMNNKAEENLSAER